MGALCLIFMAAGVELLGTVLDIEWTGFQGDPKSTSVSIENFPHFYFSVNFLAINQMSELIPRRNIFHG